MTEVLAPPIQLPNARVALYNFVQDRLVAAQDQTLAEFILARRQPGSQRAYRNIASELVAITGIDITHEAVRRWYHRAVEAAEQAEFEAARGDLHPVHAAALGGELSPVFTS